MKRKLFGWYYKNPDYARDCVDGSKIGQVIVKGVRRAVLPWKKPVVVVHVHDLSGEDLASRKVNVTQAQIDAAKPYLDYQHPPHRYSYYYTKRMQWQLRR